MDAQKLRRDCVGAYDHAIENDFLTIGKAALCPFCAPKLKRKAENVSNDVATPALQLQIQEAGKVRLQGSALMVMRHSFCTTVWRAI